MSGRDPFTEMLEARVEALDAALAEAKAERALAHQQLRRVLADGGRVLDDIQREWCLPDEARRTSVHAAGAVMHAVRNAIGVLPEPEPASP